MELAFIRAVQSVHTPFLDTVMQIFTMFGEPAFLVMIFTAVYWCVNKRQGELLAYLSAFSLALNGIVKDLVRAPRPIGQDGVRTLREKTAPGYSFPSAHTQASTTFFTGLSLAPTRYQPQKQGAQPGKKNRLLRLVFAFIVFMVGFSRIYLGVHWPRDVAVGLALGLTAAFVGRALFLRSRRLVLLYCVTAGLLCLFLPFAHSADFFKSMGCMLGFTAAAAFERRFVRFTTEIPRTHKIMRWAVGMVLLGTVYGVTHLLPEGNGFDLMRYTLVIFWGMGVYPLVFTRFEAYRALRRAKT